jgi:hypothetical protein
MLAGKIGYFRPRGFDPRSISGLELWLDFTDASTLTTSGSQISSANDKSGKGRIASQTTANNRPVLVSSAINGRSVASFDGVNDNLPVASFPAITALTAFAVAYRNWTSLTGYRVMLGQSYSANTGISLLTHAHAAALDWQAGDFFSFGNGFTAGRFPRTIAPLGTVANGRPLVMSTTLSSTASGQWINGISTSSRVNVTGTVNCASGTLNVGASGDGSFADYSVGEILFYLRALSTSERLAVESYLTTKYAIT